MVHKTKGMFDDTVNFIQAVEDVFIRGFINLERVDERLWLEEVTSDARRFAPCAGGVVELGFRVHWGIRNVADFLCCKDKEKQVLSKAVDLKTNLQEINRATDVDVEQLKKANKQFERSFVIAKTAQALLNELDDECLELKNQIQTTLVSIQEMDDLTEAIHMMMETLGPLEEYKARVQAAIDDIRQHLPRN
ncbi:MAG: hypothetical protein JSR46_06370 [Verrucomicrobia bacterium]|nr:hypothetical protein [Verrucomicrobiota bacterium]